MKPMFIIALVILVAIVSGCSEEESRQANIYNTYPEHNLDGISENVSRVEYVSINNLSFYPNPVIIQKGTTIIWTNDDDNDEYELVSDVGNVTSGDLSSGETFNHTFRIPGTYRYHGGIHPSMKGTIYVE